MESPWLTINGIEKDRAQKKEILPKFLCQKFSLINGTNAIDNNKPINGKIHTKPNWTWYSELLTPSNKLGNKIKRKNIL